MELGFTHWPHDLWFLARIIVVTFSDQPAQFAWEWGYLGHGSFGAKAGKVPDKQTQIGPWPGHAPDIRGPFPGEALPMGFLGSALGQEFP